MSRQEGAESHARLERLFADVEYDRAAHAELSRLYREANDASLVLKRRYQGSGVKTHRQKMRDARDGARRRFIDLKEY